MAQANPKSTTPAVRTHEGAPAKQISAVEELRRSVNACLLWENEFYESGISVADRIHHLVGQVGPQAAQEIALKARGELNLRHAPLLMAASMAYHYRNEPLAGETIAGVIQRADELSEMLALVARLNDVGPDRVKKVLGAQVKRGVAAAFRKFDEYQLAKYNRDRAITLRDAMFLTHPKPKDADQEALWKRLVEGFLKAPDTWEVSLSGGKDKKEVFERLLRDGKMGYMALLRNLRKMTEVGVDSSIIRDAILARKGAHRILPFRFIAAAKAAPRYETELDEAMLATLSQAPKLPGTTLVVIDVSGSMYFSSVSARSDMNRALAASALGAIMRELCEEPLIYATAGNDSTRRHKTEMVPPRRGMALVDAIYGLCHPLGSGGIFLTPVCRFLREQHGAIDRMVVITDEQDCALAGKDSPNHAEPLGEKGRNYLINVASYNRGIGYGQWVHIDGFSETVVRYIQESEIGLNKPGGQ